MKIPDYRSNKLARKKKTVRRAKYAVASSISLRTHNVSARPTATTDMLPTEWMNCWLTLTKFSPLREIEWCQRQAMVILLRRWLMHRLHKSSDTSRDDGRSASTPNDEDASTMIRNVGLNASSRATSLGMRANHDPIYQGESISSEESHVWMWKRY